MPKPLNFSPEFIDPILAGTKRATLRRPPSGYHPGDLVKAMRRNHPAFAELRIESVETLRADDLDEGVARLEGHGDVEGLRKSLERFYPGLTEFDLVCFS